jgi:hypothetical protein
LVGSASSPNVFDSTKNIQGSGLAGIALVEFITQLGIAYPCLRSSGTICYDGS